jgi:alkylhydroperoxidase family enzyme
MASVVTPTLDELIPDPGMRDVFDDAAAVHEPAVVVRCLHEAAAYTQAERAKRMHITRARMSALESVSATSGQLNLWFCPHSHTHDARKRGETEERLYLLDAWREEAGSAGLAEALTLVSQSHVPDTVYEAARGQFEAAMLVKLTVLITTINAWNRIAISFRMKHLGKATKAELAQTGPEIAAAQPKDREADARCWVIFPLRPSPCPPSAASSPSI